MLPALIPIALQFLPSLARWVFGSDGRPADDVAGAVAAAVEAVTGTSDPTAAAQALAADPAKQGELVVALARIDAERENARRQADLEQLRIEMGDVAGARAQTLALAQGGHPMAWMPAIVTFILLGLFGLVMAYVLAGSIPQDNQRMADTLMGGLYTLVTAAVSYWVGTSSGAVEMRKALQDRAGPFGQRRGGD